MFVLALQKEIMCFFEEDKVEIYLDNLCGDEIPNKMFELLSKLWIPVVLGGPRPSTDLSTTTKKTFHIKSRCGGNLQIKLWLPKLTWATPHCVPQERMHTGM